jgi:hypothetical protein
MHARQIKERIGVFIVVSGGPEVLAIAPRLEQWRERGKQFVTVRVFGGVSRRVHEIDDSGDGTTYLRKLKNGEWLRRVEAPTVVHNRTVCPAMDAYRGGTYHQLADS